LRAIRSSLVDVEREGVRIGQRMVAAAQREAASARQVPPTMYSGPGCAAPSRRGPSRFDRLAERAAPFLAQRRQAQRAERQADAVVAVAVLDHHQLEAAAAEVGDRAARAGERADHARRPSPSPLPRR
jgi:hypothetical protein